jgi:hypothetical protein
MLTRQQRVAIYLAQRRNKAAQNAGLVVDTGSPMVAVFTFTGNPSPADWMQIGAQRASFGSGSGTVVTIGARVDDTVYNLWLAIQGPNPLARPPSPWAFLSSVTYGIEFQIGPPLVTYPATFSAYAPYAATPIATTVSSSVITVGAADMIAGEIHERIPL